MVWDLLRNFDFFWIFDSPNLPKWTLAFFDYPPKKYFFFEKKKVLELSNSARKLMKKNVFFWPQKMIFFWAPGDFFGAGPEKKGPTHKKMPTMIQFNNKIDL